MFPKETVLSGANQPNTAPEIMTSAAGLYVGFKDETGAPFSRETHYLKDMREARLALMHVNIALLDPTQVYQSPFIRSS